MGFVSERTRRNAAASRKAEISLDIHLAEDLSKEGFSDLVVELFRFLLQQRQQIPLPYSTLLQDINSFKEEEEEGGRQEDEGLSPRERRERLRLRKKKARFLKNASKFSSLLENMSKDLRQEVTEKDLLTATLFFGATPVTPKEVYHVHCPPLSSTSTSSNTITPQIKRQIFRSLVTHEELFSLLGKPLPTSNIFTALKYKYLTFPSNVSAFRPKPGFLRSTTTRGTTLIHLNFILPHTLSTPGTNMKRKRGFPTYTPVPMDLCTPFTISKSAKPSLCGGGGRRPPSSAMKKLQADFKSSSISFLTEEEEEGNGDNELLGLSPLQEDEDTLSLVEEVFYEEEEKGRHLLSPSAVNSLIDSHMEKWFVSSTHLRGIKS